MNNLDGQQGWRDLRPTMFIVGVAVLAVGLAVFGSWTLDRWNDALDWLRDEGNGSAVQAIAAIGSLAATVLLLLVAWRQLHAARIAVERQLNQADESARLAWTAAREQIELAQRATREARVLAAATRDAAVAASKGVEEAERSRLNSSLPVLDLRLPWSQPVNQTTRGTFVAEVRNVGVGPAIFVNYRWLPVDYRDDDRQWMRDENGEFVFRARIADKPLLSALGPGEHVDLPFDAPWLSASRSAPIRFPDSEVHGGGVLILGYLRVTYLDVNGRSGVIQRGIEVVRDHDPGRAEFFEDEKTEFQPPGHEMYRGEA